MKLSLKLFLLLLIVTAALITLLVFTNQTRPTLSPLGDSISSLLPTQKPPFSKKIILGFLPYWTFQNVTPEHLDALTHLAYFGISLDDTGQIQTNQDSTSKELGLHRLQDPNLTSLLNQARSQSINTLIVIRVMDNSTIESLVNQPSHRQTAINQITSFLNNHQFSGLNIDFEYSGTPPQSTKQNFTLFVKDLTSNLKLTHPNLHISLDVFADAAKKDRLWQITALSSLVDHIIIMCEFYPFLESSFGKSRQLHFYNGSKILRGKRMK